MAEQSGYCVVLTTASGPGEAERLADGLVRGALAACVQMIPIRSVYVWQGELERAEEALLLIKTRRALYRDVERYIVGHHSYDVPEVVCLPVEAGLAGYLAWVEENTGPPGS